MQLRYQHVILPLFAAASASVLLGGDSISPQHIFASGSAHSFFTRSLCFPTPLKFSGILPFVSLATPRDAVLDFNRGIEQASLRRLYFRIPKISFEPARCAQGHYLAEKYVSLWEAYKIVDMSPSHQLSNPCQGCLNILLSMHSSTALNPRIAPDQTTQPKSILLPL